MNGHHRDFNRSTSSSVLFPQQQRRSYGLSRSGTAKVHDDNKDEDLALFLEMRRREKEKERNSNLLQASPPSSENASAGSPPGIKVTPSTPVNMPRRRADDLLNGEAEGDKNDYDWLLTPPETPVFTPMQMEPPPDHRARGGPVIRPLSPALKANKLVTPEAEANANPLRNGIVSRQTSISNGSTNMSSRRPVTSTGSRSSTPTSRPTLSAPRPTVSAPRSGAASSRPVTSASRSSTPTSRPTVSAPRPSSSAPRPTTSAPTSLSGASRITSTASSRPVSSRPTSSSGSRPATPTSRATIPSARPASRTATPTRRPSASNATTTNGSTNSIPSRNAPPARSSSVSRSSSMVSRITPAQPPSSRGSSPSPKSRPSPSPKSRPSPSPKSRPWDPSDMPGFSLDAPPNLRTTMPDRPISATRGRPGAPSSQSVREDPSRANRARRSCSPSVTRGRVLNDSQNSDRASLHSSRSRTSGTDMANSLGNKMVDKLMSSRRAASSKIQDDQSSVKSTSSGIPSKRPVKPLASSTDSMGFGRSFSKKSLDMALRHMDIRKSAPNTLRPLMSNYPTSSLYSVRSGASKRRPSSITDSPIATSSNASSDHSFNIALGLEGGSELEDDDIRSERGSKASAASPQGNMYLKDETESTNWLHSIDSRDSKLDHAFLYNQGSENTIESLENFVVPEDNKMTDFSHKTSDLESRSIEHTVMCSSNELS